MKAATTVWHRLGHPYVRIALVLVWFGLIALQMSKPELLDGASPFLLTLVPSLAVLSFIAARLTFERR